MTTLAELVTDVYTLTTRPDLVNETALAIRNATLKVHRSDFYPKDLQETAIQFSSAEYLQTFEYKSVFPNWRSLKYLRKYDPISDTPSIILDKITTDEVLDSYGKTKVNTVYGAGSNLQIRSNTKEAYYLLGYYAFPDVTDLGYSSWIADEQPSVILYEAALFIFKTIGYDEQVSTYTQLVAMELEMLQANNILINGS